MSLESDIQDIIDRLTEQQAELLAQSVSATFMAGFRASGTRAPISQLQNEQIKKIFKENLGAISEYNSAMGDQLANSIKDRVALGGSHEAISMDIRKYVVDTFGEGGVTIDRTGQTRTVIEVGRDGKLRRVEKVITRPYTSTVQNYSDMIARTSAHASLEAGRAEGYKKQGVTQWRFVGPMDERARFWHMELVGNVYTYGTEESDMAESVLQEPNCRHRAIPFLDNPEVDVPQSVFEKRKKDAGLFWDENKNQWTLPEM